MKIILGSRVGVIVVVYQTGVLIRTRHIIDMEFSPVEIARIHPKSGSLKNNLSALFCHQIQIPCCQIIGHNRIGNISVNMVLRGTRREKSGTLGT